MKGLLLPDGTVPAVRTGKKTIHRWIVPDSTASLWYRYLLCRRRDPDFQEESGRMQSFLLRHAPLQVGEIVFAKEPFARYRGEILYDEPEYGWCRSAAAMTVQEARTFLQITAIQVERLQDIRDEQIQQEVPVECLQEPSPYRWIPWEPGLSSLERYARWWDRTLSWKEMDRYSWAHNPVVYCYRFAFIKPEQTFRRFRAEQEERGPVL